MIGNIFAAVVISAVLAWVWLPLAVAYWAVLAMAAIGGVINWVWLAGSWLWERVKW